MSPGPVGSAREETSRPAPPAEQQRRTAVVVVTFGAHRLLEDNLATLDLAALDADTIVVDNYHSPAERDAVAATARSHRWHLVQLGTNTGFGPAVNVGVAEAKARGADTVVILNPDAVLSAGTVARLVEECRTDPRTLVAPRVVRADGSTWFDGGVLDLRTGRARHGMADAPGTRPWLTGACLVTSVELFEEVGGFDPAYFLYFEDVDLSWRCAEAGARLLLRSDLVAVHAVGATQSPDSTRAKSAPYCYYNCRNRLLFAAKHLPRRDLVRWLWHTPRISWEIMRRGGGRRQLVRSPGLLWAGVRGTAAGVLAAVLALLGRRPAREVTR